MSAVDPSEFPKRIQRIESLIQALENTADEAARQAGRELLAAVLELHAVGFGRMLTLLRDAGDAGRALLDAWAEDDLLAPLLKLHGMHPIPLGTRVRQALERVRPVLSAAGQSIALLSIAGETVTLQFSAGIGPPLSATLRQVVEEAIVEAAPEVTTLEYIDTPPTRRVALPLLGSPSAVAETRP